MFVLSQKKDPALFWADSTYVINLNIKNKNKSSQIELICNTETPLFVFAHVNQEGRILCCYKKCHKARDTIYSEQNEVESRYI